jgi:hypothetical protein
MLKDSVSRPFINSVIELRISKKPGLWATPMVYLVLSVFLLIPLHIPSPGSEGKIGEVYGSLGVRRILSVLEGKPRSAPITVDAHALPIRQTGKNKLYIITFIIREKIRRRSTRSAKGAFGKIGINTSY